MIKVLTAVALFATAGPVAAQNCAEGQRALTHDLLVGTVCIPADPKAIAFTMEEIIPAYLLGGHSVVDNRYFKSFREKYPDILAGGAAPKVDIGTYQRADIETLTLASPDVIVAFEGIDNNEKAKALAPLVEIQWRNDTTWRDLHQFIAYFLQTEKEGQAMLDTLDARMARLKTDLGDKPRTFAIARAAEDMGAIQVFTAKNFGAVILQQAGMVMGDGVLTPDAAKQVGSEWNYQMSAENLQALDVDHFFLLQSWSPENEATILASPLWATLPMVQQGRVIRVPADGEQFIRENIAYAHLVIDLVYAEVLGQSAEAAGNPNPFAGLLAK